MSKKLALLTLAIMLVIPLPLYGCFGGSDGAGGLGGDVDVTDYTVTDQTGAAVILDQPAERVVVLSPSACEIVYAMGAGNLVIGRDEYCDWPAEAQALEVVQTDGQPDIERIIALDPDLVLVSTMGDDADQYSKLTKADIAVYAIDANSLDQTYEAILQIGQLLGRDTEAQDLVVGMEEAFAGLIDSPVAGTVYFEVSPLEHGLWTAGSGTFLNDVAERLGLTNIFADLDGWVEISEQQVLELNPDYIVTLGMYPSEVQTPDEEILARANWQDVPAVQNGAVLYLPNNELTRPGPRLADGAIALREFAASHPV
ncbi:MAG: ABC transporter substrate-binding protein [Coriobacteriales bacterium]|jgi:iron complex transport system substrate-binding protein|nr:ABC transporter substrate-binding protein [Coriobacteriales bacterium]